MHSSDNWVDIIDFEILLLVISTMDQWLVFGLIQGSDPLSFSLWSGPGLTFAHYHFPLQPDQPSHYHRQLSCALPSTSARPVDIWRLSALSIVALTKGRSSYVPNYPIVQIRNSINFQAGRWKVLSRIWFTSTMRTPYVLDIPQDLHPFRAFLFLFIYFYSLSK